MKNRATARLVRCALIVLAALSLLGVGGESCAEPANDTMLMFVGETSPVVTVASRVPEAPTMAPAMVTVIGQDEIRLKGYQTLADLLADQPGFFILSGGRGSVPYLRGMRDSVLFLYDGVPMTTDVTKSFAPLDGELSLAAVERVEIVRGPGSVLWGPDAFAGVVNIVPRHGSDPPGASLDVRWGSDDRLGSALTLDMARSRWTAALTLTGLSERSYAPDYIADSDGDVLFSARVEPSDYTELVGSFDYGSWLHVSGRWSDFTRYYTLSNVEQSLTWAGEKDAPVNHLKMTVNKVVGPSHYTLTGYLQETEYQVRDADFERQQRNRASYLELLWDRRIFGKGLLTVGASWRRNSVDGALVRDGFLPEFLAQETPLFTPQVSQADFENRLVSAFSQFRYQWGESMWWAGIRLDDHSQYETTFTHSLGYYRRFSEPLHLKITYGTAFRSPYSSQLFDDQPFEPESVRTLSGQLVWEDQAKRRLALTLFHSSVADHRVEDPYGGLSLPADRTFYGAELSGEMPLGHALRLQGDLTLLGGGDGSEFYRTRSFCFARPDGSQVCVYDEWDESVDAGPDWLARLGLVWRLGQDHSLAVTARASGAFEASFSQGSQEISCERLFLLDLNYRFPGIWPGRDAFSLRMTNLLDQDAVQPDVYGPIEIAPFQVELLWRWRY